MKECHICKGIGRVEGEECLDCEGTGLSKEGKGFKAKDILLVSGAILVISQILFLIVSSFYSYSFLLIAVSELFANILVIGFVLLVIYSFLYLLDRKKKVHISRKQNRVTNLLLFVVIISLFSLLRSMPIQSVIHSIKDIQAVQLNELYITEGRVKDTYIQRTSSSSKRIANTTYRQYITIDNEVQDKFSIRVSSYNDYVFQLNEMYVFKALPYSKTVLEYAHY